MANGVTSAAPNNTVTVQKAATQGMDASGAAVAQPAEQISQQTPALPTVTVVQPADTTAPVAAPGLPVDGTPAAAVAAVAGTANTPALDDQESLSERVAIPVLPAGARAPVIGSVKPSTRTQVSINWPTPDEVVLSTQSPIWVELDSQPSSLKAMGLQAEIWIDDKLAVSGERPLLPLVLPEVGMHKLQVRLVDSEGRSVAESDSQLMDVRLGATQIR